MYCTLAPKSFSACFTPSHVDWLNDLSSILPTSVTRPTQKTSGLEQSALAVPLVPAPPHAVTTIESTTRSDINAKTCFLMELLLWGKYNFDLSQCTRSY